MARLVLADASLEGVEHSPDAAAAEICTSGSGVTVVDRIPLGLQDEVHVGPRKRITAPSPGRKSSHSRRRHAVDLETLDDDELQRGAECFETHGVTNAEMSPSELMAAATCLRDARPYGREVSMVRLVLQRQPESPIAWEAMRSSSEGGRRLPGPHSRPNP